MDSAKHENPKLCPFRVDVPEVVLQHIRSRIQAFPWHAMPNLEGWEHGANLAYMKVLCEYWLDEFDWRRQEAALNRFPQFTAHIDDLDIHFVYEKGSGTNAKPLLLAHGWPGSIAEFRHIIEPLAHPQRFGGSVDDAFDVIAPSLPGFGFSSAPDRPWGPRRMADTLNKLMTDVLGYESYVAQGGDWGGAIASWLGYDHGASCEAIHINILTMRHRDGPQGPEEEKWAADFEADQVMQNGYRTQQATKPQTLGYAMMDSPVGVAAWIIEKFNAWSDTEEDNVESAHSRDELLANIMIYLVDEKNGSSQRGKVCW